MKILAFDTSMSACSVALVSDNKLIGKLERMNIHGHSEILIPLIEKLLSNAKTHYSDLNLIAVTIGPGSFTGIRVGLSVAKAINTSLGIKTTGIMTTELLAHEALTKRISSNLPIASIIDARRAEVYIQIFDNKAKPLSKATCLLPQNATKLLGKEKWCLIGDGTQKVLQYVEKTHNIIDTETPDVAILAQIALDKTLTKQQLEPAYIRAPDVSQSKKAKS